jgi:hypothetical protein
MPDLHRLTDEEARSLQRFERARDAELRFELLRLVARSRVRMATAVSASLDPARRSHMKQLAALARRLASGYDRLVHLYGAIRFSRRLAEVAARRAGLRKEARE